MVLLMVVTNLPAQEVVEQIAIGHSLQLTSDALDEERKVFIYLPDGYHQSEIAYPVLYLLDGGTHFIHGSGIVQFLSVNGMMPQTIVVAIPNTARGRDFTPTVEEGRQVGGGAENFLDFLQKELIPLIDNKYRTQEYRILFGHSLTGMFSVYTFATRPNLFNAYIAASPYLMYDNNYTVKKAAELLNKDVVAKKTLYITIGDEPRYFESLDELTANLKKVDRPCFEWKYVKMDKDNHGSVVHKTIYDGLEFIFSGWQIPAEKAKDLVSIQNHYKSLSERFGFTVNPREFLLNQLGYQVMGNNDLEKATEIFLANVKLYPNSDNVYDSLAEAYEKSGNLELAAENYSIAVEKGTKNNSRNLPVYQKNLERVQAQINN